MAASVVLVHGIRTSATMWRRQLRYLEARGHLAVAPDLPGHGSRMAERFTRAGAMRTIDAAVAEAGAVGGPVLLVGFSLGGYLAVHWAGEERRPIAGLVATSCGTEPLPAILTAYRWAAAAIHRLPDRGRALNDWSVRTFIRYPGSPEDVLAGGVALEVMGDTLRELSGIRIRRSLSRIEQPVWLVNGQLDHFRAQERAFVAAAPRGRLVRVAGANHMVSLTRPTQFNALLATALDEVDGRPRPDAADPAATGWRTIVG